MEKENMSVDMMIDRIQKEVKDAGEKFDRLLAGQQCNCQQPPQMQIQSQLPSLSQFVADLVEAEMESYTYMKSLSANDMMDDTVADAYKEHLTNMHEAFMTAVRALH